MISIDSISIGINPIIIDFWVLSLSWHGLLTFVATVVSVFLVVRWGSREGLVADAIYSVAVWSIVGGVIGARLLYIFDQWDYYQDNPERILYVWQGGIAIFGSILGGFVGGSLYIIVRNSRWFLAMWGRYFRFLGELREAPLPGIGRLADIAAPAMLLSQAIGRVGDIINGEHCANFTGLPWGVIYSHPERGSLACEERFGIGATHPAVAYELLMDLAILGLIWPLRKRLRPHGMFFALYLATYSVGRFFLSFLRTEFNEYGGLGEAQIVALVVIVITIPLLIFKAQLVKSGTQPTVRRRKAR